MVVSASAEVIRRVMSPCAAPSRSAPAIPFAPLVSELYQQFSVYLFLVPHIAPTLSVPVTVPMFMQSMVVVELSPHIPPTFLTPLTAFPLTHRPFVSDA